MPRKLIIDADPGIGDALAIALAAIDPAVDLIGVTATAGCISGQLATHNILAVTESVDPSRSPRLGGSDLPRPDFGKIGHLGFMDPVSLQGNYGLGGVELPYARLHNQHESAKVLVDLVRNHPHEVTILTLGPLTNVERAIDLAPDFLTLVKELVCCGGAISGGGDATAAAEFNFFADPSAAQRVLRAPATKTLVPLDVCNRLIMSYELFNRFKDAASSRLHWFCTELLPFALTAHHEQLGLEGMPLREVAALAVVAQHQFCETRPMHVDVETEGELTRGAVICDRRRSMRKQPNVDVVQSLDVQGILDYVLQISRVPS